MPRPYSGGTATMATGPLGKDPLENATIADPLQCSAEAGKSPHTSWDG